MPPGWRSDGRGATTEDLRAQAASAAAIRPTPEAGERGTPSGIVTA
jgi:hypothetical protein